jgi:hypothetical protein
MSDDKLLQSRRSALKCMAYGGGRHPIHLGGPSFHASATEPSPSAILRAHDELWSHWRHGVFAEFACQQESQKGMAMQQSNLGEVWREPSPTVTKEKVRHARTQLYPVAVLRPRRALEKRIKLRTIVIDGGPYRRFRIC